jgi:hypothetical protein
MKKKRVRIPFIDKLKELAQCPIMISLKKISLFFCQNSSKGQVEEPRQSAEWHLA